MRTVPTTPVIPSQDGYMGVSYDRNMVNGITIPPYFHAAMQRFAGDGGTGFGLVEGSERVMRYMMETDPILFGIDRVVRAMVTEGNHSLIKAVDEPKSRRGKEYQRFKRSEELLAFHEGWMSRLKRPRELITWHMLEALPFGSKLAQIKQEILDGKVVPVSISPKPRTAYRWNVDDDNHVLGVTVGGISSQSKVPTANLMWLTIGGMDDTPNGGPALAAAYDAWYRKGNYLRDEVIASAQSAGSNLVLSQPNFPPADSGYDGMVKMYADDGVTIIDVPETELAAKAGSQIRNGTSAALPPGWQAQFLASLSKGFGDQIDRCDREMVTAFIGSARMTQEAQHGSKADSGTSEGVALTIRDWLRGLACGMWNEAIRVRTEINYGPEYMDVLPRYDIVTEETDNLEWIGDLLTGNWGNFNLEQKNYFLSKLGAPLSTEEDEVLPTDTQDEKEIDAEDQAASAEEVRAEFSAYFPKSRV